MVESSYVALLMLANSVQLDCLCIEVLLLLQLSYGAVLHPHCEGCLGDLLRVASLPGILQLFQGLFQAVAIMQSDRHFYLCLADFHAGYFFRTAVPGLGRLEALDEPFSEEEGVSGVWV